MKIESQRIEELLVKYRENRCSREEFEELILLAQNPDHEQVIKEITRSDWEQNPLENPGNQVNSPDSIPNIRHTMIKVAAAVAILVSVGIGLTQWFSTSGSIEYTTGNGEVKQIVLPDGSEVTLNANSSLTWIPSHPKNEDRSVSLTGEAFFEVIKEVESSSGLAGYRGFQVLTPKMTIHVLGTSFNVSARSENTEVFLQEGSVELQIPEEGEEVQRMVPGEKVILDNESGSLIKQESEELSTSASWVTGILNYKDKSMEEVLINLSEIFGVEISVEDPALQMKKINLGVPYMDWENTKRALEMAVGVEFLENGKSYIVVQKEMKNIKIK